MTDEFQVQSSPSGRRGLLLQNQPGMWQELAHFLLSTAGLSHCTRFYRDPSFWLALLAALPVLLFLYPLMQHPGSASHTISFQLLLSLLLWHPLVEEIFFRGILQQQLQQRSGWTRRWKGISMANLLTSLLFTLLHFVNHSPVWAASVLIPSLVFGYFRERHGHIYTSLLLHSLYNLGYLTVIQI